MPNVKNNVAAKETQRRLLEAAGEVFAERGVHNTTIKQITDRAGVSIAAVNYHFRDKFELYAAVMRHLVETDAPRMLPPAPAEGSPRQRLCHFIQGLIEKILDPAERPWRPMLIWRELIQPTPSFDLTIEGFVKPLMARMEPPIRDILGPRASELRVQLTMNSIFGQCLYYFHDAEIVRRINPKLLQLEHSEMVATIADHITQFTLRALEGRKSTSSARGGKGKKRATSQASR